MVVLHSGMNLFSFIEREHPFYPPIENLKTQLIATPLYQAIKQRLDAGEEIQVRISMKAHPSADSVWSLKGFYLSLQFKERLGSPRFNASTFFCSAKRGSIESFEFPQDPYLTTMATYFNNHESGQQTAREFDVLRYYPGKRLTFRTTTPEENGPPTIGKFVRSSSVQEIYNKLVKIHDVMSRSASSFSVATPMGIDVDNGVFLQEAKPGKALADLINKENFSDSLHSVGEIHRDLHRLDVPDLPKFDFAVFLRNLVLAIEWISFFRQETRSFFDNVRGLLLKHVPHVDAVEYTFCHGDFSCPQVIKNSHSCLVIDFDDCMLGDPYLEIARLMVFLKYDVPLFKDWFLDPKQKQPELLEEACRAYLNGYQERAQQALDQKRLLWYQICLEIQYLARLFKRDLFHAVAFERTLRIIRDLSERFLQEEGEDF
jgi:thiamine kinase-like enzyme